jgi:hypothetical protein
MAHDYTALDGAIIDRVAKGCVGFTTLCGAVLKHAESLAAHDPAPWCTGREGRGIWSGNHDGRHTIQRGLHRGRSGRGDTHWNQGFVPESVSLSCKEANQKKALWIARIRALRVNCLDGFAFA